MFVTEPIRQKEILVSGADGKISTMCNTKMFLQIEEKGHKSVLILEDDASFEPTIRRQWSRMFADVQEFVPNWDLV